MPRYARFGHPETPRELAYTYRTGGFGEQVENLYGNFDALDVRRGASRLRLTFTFRHELPSTPHRERAGRSGAAFGAVQTLVVDQFHRQPGGIHRCGCRDPALAFRGAGHELILRYGAKPTGIVIVHGLQKLSIPLLVDDEVRETAGRQYSDAPVTFPGGNCLRERNTEVIAAACGRAVVVIPAIDVHRHLRLTLCSHDVLV